MPNEQSSFKWLLDKFSGFVVHCSKIKNNQIQMLHSHLCHKLKHDSALLDVTISPLAGRPAHAIMLPRVDLRPVGIYVLNAGPWSVFH